MNIALIGITVLIAAAIIIILLLRVIKTLVILKAIIKIISIALVLGILATIVIGYFVVQDAKDFRDNFANSTNLVIITHKDTFVHALTITAEKSEIKPLAVDAIKDLESRYRANPENLALEKAYYKIILIDVAVLEEMNTTTFVDANINLTTNELRSVLISKDAKSTLVTIVAQKNDVRESEVAKELRASSSEIKTYCATFLISYYFNPEHLPELSSALATKRVRIIEETALFWTLKYLPAKTLQEVIPNINKWKENNSTMPQD